MTQISNDCFAGVEDLMPLDEAISILEKRIAPVTGTRKVALVDAAAGILAEDIVSGIDVPPHDNSAVDGYAFRHADLSPEGKTEFEIVGQAAAGHPFDGGADWILPTGMSVRIFTGAVMPAGADTVVMQEDTQPSPSKGVTVASGLSQGANRRKAGEDITSGKTILHKGQRLGPQHLGLAASVGMDELMIYEPLKVAVFSTGDEIREPGQTLEKGAIYDSNRYTLAAMCRNLGAQVSDLGILPDDLPTIRTALGKAAEEHDLILTSGGVSVGEEDHVKAAVDALGSLHFWRLAIKPGRPVALGQIGTTPFAGLPGNPVAVMVTFFLIARPMILKLSGATDLRHKRFMVRAGFEHKKKPQRREFVRARLETADDGVPTAFRYESQGSGILSSMVNSNGLVDLAQDVTDVESGMMVNFLPFSEFGA